MFKKYNFPKLWDQGQLQSQLRCCNCDLQPKALFICVLCNRINTTDSGKLANVYNEDGIQSKLLSNNTTVTDRLVTTVYSPNSYQTTVTDRSIASVMKQLSFEFLTEQLTGRQDVTGMITL